MKYIIATALILLSLTTTVLVATCHNANIKIAYFFVYFIVNTFLVVHYWTEYEFDKKYDYLLRVSATMFILNFFTSILASLI